MHASFLTQNNSPTKADLRELAPLFLLVLSL